MQRMNSKTLGTAKQLGNSWKSISLASLTKLLYLRYQSLRSTRRRSQKTLFRSLSTWQSSTGLFLSQLSPSPLRRVSCSLARSSSLSARWSWVIELLGEPTIRDNSPPPYRFWITGKNNIISRFSSLNAFYILSWDHVLMKRNLMIWLMDAFVLLLLIKSMPCHPLYLALHQKASPSLSLFIALWDPHMSPKMSFFLDGSHSYMWVRFLIERAMRISINYDMFSLNPQFLRVGLRKPHLCSALYICIFL